MATSQEKLALLKAQLAPQLVEALTGPRSELPPTLRVVMGPALAMAQPLAEARIDAWLALPPEVLDRYIDRIIDFLASVRSDGATPIIVSPGSLDAPSCYALRGEEADAFWAVEPVGGALERPGDDPGAHGHGQVPAGEGAG